MKKSIIALMIAGIVGLTGCSSDNKTEDLKNNLQPEGSVQVDSQNQVELSKNKPKLEKLVLIGDRKEDRTYLDMNSIKDVTSMYEGTKTKHVQYDIKLVITNPKKYDTIYAHLESDCSGKVKNIKTDDYLNDNLVISHPKNEEEAQNYGIWENVPSNGMLSYVESLVCKE